MRLIHVFLTTSVFLARFVAVYSPPSPASEDADPEGGESLLSSLINSFRGGFNVTHLMATFRPPDCIQECFDEFIQTIDNPLSVNDLFADGPEICGQYELAKKCLTEKESCSSDIIDIGLIAYDLICRKNRKGAVTMLSCARKNAMPIHSMCESECKLGAKLAEVVSLNAKSDSVNVYDSKGRKLLSLPDLHVLCNSSACYLDCLRSIAYEKCPSGGSDLIDEIMESVVKRRTGVVKMQGMKALDSYTKLISSVLPRHCERLLLQRKDFVLTTERPLLVSPPPSDESAVFTTVESTILAPPVIGVTKSPFSGVSPKSFLERTLHFDGLDTKLQCRMIDTNGSEVTMPDLRTLVSTISQQLLGEDLNKFSLSDSSKERRQNGASSLTTFSWLAIPVFLFPSLFPYSFA